MKVHVIAAHPDDEVLGAGIAIARHADAGDEVTVTFLTDGTGARTDMTVSDATKRRHDAEKSAAILGIKNLRFHTFPDNALDGIALLDVVKAVEKDAAAINAEIVYIHHAGDLNVDHKIAAKAAMTCYRPLPSASARRILAFETASATGWDFGEKTFVPNVFIDGTAHLPRKVAALEAYEAEIRPYPHVRSAEALTMRARAWGTLMGLIAAEPFMLVRDIQR